MAGTAGTAFSAGMFYFDVIVQQGVADRFTCRGFESGAFRTKYVMWQYSDFRHVYSGTGSDDIVDSFARQCFFYTSVHTFGCKVFRTSG